MAFTGEFEIARFAEADRLVQYLGQFGHTSNGGERWPTLEDSAEGRTELARRIDALLVKLPPGNHGDVRLHALRRYRASLVA